MVKISNSKDDIDSSCYLKSQLLGFSALSKDHHDQKGYVSKFMTTGSNLWLRQGYCYGAKFIMDYHKELAKFNDITLNGYKSITIRFHALCNNYSKLEDVKPMVRKRTIEEQLANELPIVMDPLNQTNKIKKKKKLKAKRISKTHSSAKLDTTAELIAKNMCDQSIKSENLSILITNNTNLPDTVKKQNPNKKVRLTQESSTSILSNKNSKVKPKKSKKKSSILSKKSIKKEATSISSMTTVFNETYMSTKFEFNNFDSKTPMKSSNKQLNSIMESNSQTIKAKTRVPSIHASGKVKQMVEMVEARMKTSMQNTPSTTIKPISSKQPQYSESIKNKKTYLENLSTLAAVAKKLRSSIDERKTRISNSKKETKRQSSKRINAFLTDISNQNHQAGVKQNKPILINQASTVKKKLNYQQSQSKQEIKSETNDYHEELSVTQQQELKSKRNGLADLIISNSTVQQQYRIKQTSSVHSEFNRFLDRNTPNKLNKIELEEKRKAELLFKEEREQKRLQERERQTQAKIETAKKKREEKMKKIEELKTQQQEDVIKRKEDLEAKQREAQEKKRRLQEEKRKEEFEKQRIKEQQRLFTTISVAHSNNNINIMNSAQKTKLTSKTQFTPMPSSAVKQTLPFENKTNEICNKNKLPPKALNYDVCKTPSVSNQKKLNLKGTPIAMAKKKPYENYDIGNLNSGDDTDDDEEPSKPIPEWAKGDTLTKKAISQCYKGINYTKLFKASSQNEIILENIFKIKRKKFTERSSSANWNSPPVWSTNGLNGDESFRQLHQV